MLARSRGFDRSSRKECLNNPDSAHATKAGLPVLTSSWKELNLIQQVADSGSFLHTKERRAPPNVLGLSQANLSGGTSVAQLGPPDVAAHHGQATMPAVAHDLLVRDIVAVGGSDEPRPQPVG